MTGQVIIAGLGTIAFAALLGVLSGQFRFLGILLAYAIVLAVASGISIASSYPNGPAPLPYLMGSDGEGFYDEAMKLTIAGLENFSEIIPSNYVGFQIYLALWFVVFGDGLGVALIANHVLLLLSVVCVFNATKILTTSLEAALLACVAMMLTGSHVFHALILLKEPALNLAFGLLLLSLAMALKQRGGGPIALVLFMIAVAILAVMRGALLLFVVVLMSWIATLFLRRRGLAFILMAITFVLLAPMAQTFTNYTLDADFFSDTTLRNTVLSETLRSGEVDTAGVVGRILDVYLGLPVALKVLFFFVPTLLQLSLPFDVWSKAFIDDHFSVFFGRNCNLVWLLFGAVWTLYVVVYVRHLRDPLIARLLLAGVMCYVTVAIIFGGAIPRYGAPALIFTYPAVGYWWHRSRLEPVVRQHVQRFFRWYYAGLIVLMLPYLLLNLLRAV